MIAAWGVAFEGRGDLFVENFDVGIDGGDHGQRRDRGGGVGGFECAGLGQSSRGAECGADLRCTFVDRPPMCSFECRFDLSEGQCGGSRRSGGLGQQFGAFR